jgi:hypothetical protein
MLEAGIPFYCDIIFDGNYLCTADFVSGLGQA